MTDYLAWQAAQMGRDVNPDELIARLKAAGVKRCVVSSPTFQIVQPVEVATVSSVNVDFLGLEDD